MLGHGAKLGGDDEGGVACGAVGATQPPGGVNGDDEGGNTGEVAGAGEGAENAGEGVSPPPGTGVAPAEPDSGIALGKEIRCAVAGPGKAPNTLTAIRLRSRAALATKPPPRSRELT